MTCRSSRSAALHPFNQDSIVAYLKKHSVIVADIRNRFGAEGNGVSIYLNDPEGNTVELKGPSDGALKPPPSAGGAGRPGR